MVLVGRDDCGLASEVGDDGVGVGAGAGGAGVADVSGVLDDPVLEGGGWEVEEVAC